MSILTPSLNQARWLGENLASVAGQDYPWIEQVVADGGSTDGSIDLLRKASSMVRYVSEPDLGQSDAINKAFRRARGEIIGWLNSDDAYFSRRAVSEAVRIFADDPRVDLVYGHAALVDAANSVRQLMWVPPPSRRILGLHNYIVQPAAFIRRSAVGTNLVDQRFDYAMDRELWLRLWSRGRVRRLGSIVAIDRHHGLRKSYARPDLELYDRQILESEYGIHPFTALQQAKLKALTVLFRWVGLTLLHGASDAAPTIPWVIDSWHGLLVRQTAVPRSRMGFGLAPTSHAIPDPSADRRPAISVDLKSEETKGSSLPEVVAGDGDSRPADNHAAKDREVTDGSETKPRVIYWNNIPAPYMVERFNAISRRGNLDLEVWFGARTELDRSWTIDESSWRFTYRYLPRVGVGHLRLSLPTPVATAQRPDLLVSLYATPSFLAGLRLAWWRGWRTALWVEVTFDSWVRRRRWKEAIKRSVLQRVDGIITAGEDGRAFAMRYGVFADRIHVARHVVDVDYFAAEAARSRPGRDQARGSLGLSGVVFLYVGRLWSGKGIGPLLDAYTAIEREVAGEATLLVVGDGPEENRIAQAAMERGLNIRLAGFHQRADLPRLYAASDVFVFPTLGDPYGLVVDEAMATGLPIVSTTAAGEIRERVIDGVNGYLVPPGDSRALASAMRRLAIDPGLRLQMGARSAAMIASHTVDSWAEAFEQAVDGILALQRPGSSL